MDLFCLKVQGGSKINFHFLVVPDISRRMSATSHQKLFTEWKNSVPSQSDHIFKSQKYILHTTILCVQTLITIPQKSTLKSISSYFVRPLKLRSYVLGVWAGQGFKMMISVPSAQPSCTLWLWVSSHGVSFCHSPVTPHVKDLHNASLAYWPRVNKYLLNMFHLT